MDDCKYLQDVTNETAQRFNSLRRFCLGRCKLLIQMATVVLEAQLTPELMSQAVRAMSEVELQSLERSLRDERLRRLSPDVPDDEAALLEAVRAPLPHQARWEQLQQWRESGDWNETLRSEMLELNQAREAANVRRVAAAMRLANLRGVSFKELWPQFVGSPAPLAMS